MRYFRFDIGTVYAQYVRYTRKYFSINLKHSATVEIRIFKGTSKFESIMAVVQLCDRLVEVCVDNKLDDIRKLSFYEIIAPLCEKSEFKEHMANLLEKGYFNFDEELRDKFASAIA